MKRGIVTGLTAGAIVLALGLAALNSSTRAAYEQRRGEAFGEALLLAQHIQQTLHAAQEELLALAAVLSDDADGRARFAALSSPPADRHFWWHDAQTLRGVPAVPAGHDGIRSLLQTRSRADTPGVWGPLTTDNGTDVVVVARPMRAGWLAMSLPLADVVGPWRPRAAAPGSLRLSWARGGTGPIYRVSAREHADPLTVPVVVPGGIWELSVGAQSIEIDPAFRSAGLIVVLVIALSLGLGGYRLWNRPAQLERHTAELEQRVVNLSRELSTEITHHRDIETDLRRLAQMDTSTGLPHRRGLVEELDRALSTERRSPGEGLSLVVIDFEDLSHAGQTLGLGFVEATLTQVVERLTKSTGEKNYIYRIAETQLAFFCPGSEETDTTRFVASVLTALEGEYVSDGQRVYVTPSAGITTTADGYRTGAELLDKALAALEEAVRTNARWSVFRPEARDDRVSMLQLETDLRGAADRDEFRLLYQPIVGTRDQGLRGFECLVRWEHPREGLLGPDAFISLAEDLEIIPRLTRWVLEQAIRQARAWLPLNPGGFYLSVNLSAQDLTPDLLEWLPRRLGEAGVPPSTFRLEVTESALIADVTRVNRLLTALDAQGIRIVLDDFGTGFSSLSYLRNLPFQIIKIDKSFVESLEVSSRDFGVVKSVIGLVHYLEMECVAEGIENEEQRQLLEMLNCDYCQGYLFGRPMTATQAEEYLAKPVARNALAGAR